MESYEKTNSSVYLGQNDWLAWRDMVYCNCNLEKAFSTCMTYSALNLERKCKNWKRPGKGPLQSLVPLLSWRLALAVWQLLRRIRWLLTSPISLALLFMLAHTLLTGRTVLRISSLVQMFTMFLLQAQGFTSVQFPQERITLDVMWWWMYVRRCRSAIALPRQSLKPG